MADKHMRCSISFNIREMQKNYKMRYFYIYAYLKFKKTGNTKCCQRHRATAGMFIYCRWECIYTYIRSMFFSLLMLGEILFWSHLSIEFSCRFNAFTNVHKKFIEIQKFIKNSYFLFLLVNLLICFICSSLVTCLLYLNVQIYWNNIFTVVSYF